MEIQENAYELDYELNELEMEVVGHTFMIELLDDRVDYIFDMPLL